MRVEIERGREVCPNIMDMSVIFINSSTKTNNVGINPSYGGNIKDEYSQETN